MVNLQRYVTVPSTGERMSANTDIEVRYDRLLEVASYALADLERILPEFEPSGDRKDPAWETLRQLRRVIDEVSGRQYVLLHTGAELWSVASIRFGEIEDVIVHDLTYEVAVAYAVARNDGYEDIDDMGLTALQSVEG